MLKEIFEQPNTVRDTFRSRISLEEGRVDLEGVLPADVAKGFHRVCIIACGTSYHAGLVSRYWFEEVAGIPAMSRLLASTATAATTKSPERSSSRSASRRDSGYAGRLCACLKPKD